jgi:hypothetical protein
MFEKDNFIPPLSSHELHRQASIERNLVIQAYMRTAMRAAAKIAARALPTRQAIRAWRGRGTTLAPRCSRAPEPR